MEHGLFFYPPGGTRDASLGDHVLLAPPFMIDEDEMMELVEKLAMSIKDVLP